MTCSLNSFAVSMILDGLAKLLQDTLENKLQESIFVNSEYYGKFVVALDEMLPQVRFYPICCVPSHSFLGSAGISRY